MSKPKYDERTLRGWPLPHWLNKLDVDVERLRETINAIDSIVTLIENSNHEISGRQDFLDTRMEVIAGSATEDTEVLDARVDAEGNVHPNLGHHVRSIQDGLIGAISDIRYGVQEFQGLLKQFNELAHAQTQGEFNAQDAYNRRKAELQQEEKIRAGDDDVLQTEADELSKAVLRQSLNLKQEAEQRHSDLKRVTEEFNDALSREETARRQADSDVRSDTNDAINAEAEIRQSQDNSLQTQVDDLAEAGLQDSLNLLKAETRERKALEQEAEIRTEQDEVQQEQINSLANADIHQSLNLLREATQRRKLAEALASETANREENDDVLHEELKELQQNLDCEEYARRSDDEAQQGQIDSLTNASLQNSFNIQEETARRESADKEEAQARIIQGEVLQLEINNLSNANLRQNLNLRHEAEQRRKLDEALKSETTARIESDDELHTGLNSEIQLRSSEDSALQTQIDDLSREAMQDKFNAFAVNERRKQEIHQEASIRAEQDEVQQEQINHLAESGLRQSLNLHSESEKRREGFSDIHSQLEKHNERIEQHEEQSIYHQAEIEDLINAMLRSSLNLHDALELRRDALNHEAEIRSEQIHSLRTQAQELSEAGIQQSLNIHNEAEQRRLLSSKTLRFTDTQLALNDCLQKQVDDLIVSTLRSSANLHETLERRREGLHQEAQSRTDNDEALQKQTNDLSKASLQGSLNLHEAQIRNRAALQQEAQIRAEHEDILQSEIFDNAQTSLKQSLNLARESKKRRELEQTVAGIKSPVDWSKSESLAIPEPRCAIVNFSGIKSMPTSKTADTPAIMEFWDMQGNYFRKNIVCSAQGSSSLSYVKKNVKFDLLNEDGSEFNLKIGNWVVQDGFHLKAYYTDFFRGIGVTSYKFWDEVMRFNGLDKDRPYKRVIIDSSVISTNGTRLNNPEDLTLQLDTGALCHPDAFPCIVYLNGTFYGVFSWQIKKQRKNYRMDKSTVEHIHLDGTLSTANFWNGTINWGAFEIRNPNKLYTMDGKKYDGDSPKELIDETSDKYNPDDKDHVRSAKVKKYIKGLVQSFTVLKNLYSAYRSSPSDETLAAVKAKYEEIFDWENQRDYLIFSDVIKNSDGFAKNWQWTTYDGVKWFVNAYDLDMSYGGHWQGIQITAPLTDHITTSTALPTYYAALLYRSELESRYEELRDAGIISVNNILSKLEDWTARIGVGNYELEFERWPNSPCILNYTDSIYRVKRWLEVEISNMDSLYGYSIADETLTPETFNDDEAELRRSEDTAIQAQVNDLSRGTIQDRLNSSALNSRRKSEIQQEAMIRREYDAVQDSQIQLLSHAEIREGLLSREANERRKAEILHEILMRSKNDGELQAQIDELAFAVIKTAINEREARERLSEYVGRLYQAVADTGNLKYMGAGIASTSEIHDMLSDVLSGSDSGEYTDSEIPEELQNRVATSTEISEMLDETFQH